MHAEVLRLDTSFLGEIKPVHIASQIASGDLNPATMKKYDYKLLESQDFITKLKNCSATQKPDQPLTLEQQLS